MSPATVVVFGDDAPDLAVIDSSFLFQALIDPQGGDTRHEACRAFLERLRDSSSVLVISPLLYLEAPSCWRRLYNRGALQASRLGLDDSVNRQVAYEEASAMLRGLLESFETYEIRLTHELLDRATSVAGQYNLNAHDALHVAIAERTDVHDLVTVDRDFVRVDWLTVWCPPGNR